MTLGRYIFIMGLTTLLCWSAFFYVLFNVDPTQTNILGFLFFYLSLFLAFVGTNSIVGLLLRMCWNKDELPIFRLVTVAYRQGIWLATLVVTALWMQGHGYLKWWNLLILIVALGCVEFVIMSSPKRPVYHR